MEHNLPAGIVPASQDMVEAIAAGMRPEHVREINLAFPLEPEQALRVAVLRASVCFAGVRDGEILFVCGVGRVPALTMAGFGWLMGTRAMDRHGIWIADVSRKMLPILHRRTAARCIENWIPADYTAARKWLGWLGFDEGGIEPIRNGVPHIHVFHDMDLLREDDSL